MRSKRKPEKICLQFPINFICDCDNKFNSSDHKKNLDKIINEHFEKFHPGFTLTFNCSLCNEKIDKYVVVSSHYGQHKSSLA